MKTHLTEDLLIQLQFDLLESDAAATARNHLAECEQCRQQAGQLQKKFASLDLLRSARHRPPRGGPRGAAVDISLSC